MEASNSRIVQDGEHERLRGFTPPSEPSAHPRDEPTEHEQQRLTAGDRLIPRAAFDDRTFGRVSDEWRVVTPSAKVTHAQHGLAQTTAQGKLWQRAQLSYREHT